jgi:hypothetical protein
MMGVRMPETCWAIFKWQVINLRIYCIWLVDSVKNVTQVQHTKLGIVSYLLEWLKYYNSKLHKVDKLEIIKLQCCSITTMWYWAASSTGLQPFVFCLQYAYERLSRSVWSEDITSRWIVWSVSCRTVSYEFVLEAAHCRCRMVLIPQHYNIILILVSFIYFRILIFLSFLQWGWRST